MYETNLKDDSTKGFEIKGFWWLPTKPKNKIFGIFRFNFSEGGSLETISSFESRIDRIIETYEEYPIILGKSINEIPITLNRTYLKKASIGGNYFIYDVNVIFLGNHFPLEEKIRFDGIQLRYTHLEEIIPFFYHYDIENYENYKIIKLPPEKIALNLNVNNIFQLLYKVGSVSKFMQKKIIIQKYSFFEMLFFKKMNFDEMMIIADRLRTFLELIFLERVFPTSYIGLLNNKKVEIFMNILSASVGVSYYKKSIYINNLKIFLERIETFLNNWFMKYEDLYSTIRYYFYVVHHPELDIEEQFLNLIKALEGYHRLRYNNFDLPEEKHKERISDILNSTPKKYKKWLNEKLKFSNEPNLRKRVKEIIEDFYLKEIFCPKNYNDQKIKKEIKKFINRVINLRNSLTHPKKKNISEKWNEFLLRIYDIAFISKKLKILIEACLLKEIGLSEEEIKSILENDLYKREIELYIKKIEELVRTESSTSKA